MLMSLRSLAKHRCVIYRTAAYFVRYLQFIKLPSYICLLETLTVSSPYCVAKSVLRSNVFIELIEQILFIGLPLVAAS